MTREELEALVRAHFESPRAEEILALARPTIAIVPTPFDGEPPLGGTRFGGTPDLPPGIAKFKQGGGHGGHNGLKDIIARMGNNNNFFRLRLGIGHPGAKELVAGFVLTKAPSSEQSLIEAALDESLRATDILFKQDMTKAMHRLHSFKAEKV